VGWGEGMVRYSLKRYERIIRNFGFEKIRHFENWLLLDRFGFTLKDRLIYELTLKLLDKVGSKDEVINYLVEKYKSSYEYHLTTGSHFWLEDRDKFVRFISTHISFDELKSLFLESPPRYAEFDVFRGYHFYYKLGDELKEECKWDEVYENTLKALEDTKGRIKPFLKALIALYTEEKPSLTLGYSLNRIQEKIIELEGRVRNLTPVDYVALKAYKIYYKTGSRRYPIHALPVESIPPIEKALEDFRA
jgi:hypothetical protein